MSRIPNSAMPYARDTGDRRASRRQSINAMLASGRRWTGDHVRSAGKSVRRHPGMTASAVAATLLAGLAAAFAPRLLRRRGAFSR